MKRSSLLLAIALSALLGACGGSDPDPAQYGADPALRQELLRRTDIAGGQGATNCDGEKGYQRSKPPTWRPRQTWCSMANLVAEGGAAGRELKRRT